MKKLILLLAAATLAVACARTFDTHQTGEKAIGFNSWSETLTKVRTQGASTFAEGDAFNVSGYKTVAGSNIQVFSNVTVTKGDPAWAYAPTTPLRYWDTNASSYTFFAVSSPTTAVTVRDDGTVGATAVDFAGNNNDILVADQKEVAKGSEPFFNNYAAVPLTFKHIATILDLKVKKPSTFTATVAVTKVSLVAVDKSGTVEITGYTTNVPSVTWTPTAGNYIDANTLGVTSVTLPSNVGTAGDDLIDDLIVMPQSLTADTKLLRISYTVNDGTSTTTYTDVDIKLNQFDKTNNETNTADFISAWEAGKRYTYYLTLSSNPIVFTGTITDWVAADAGYHYLVK